MTTTPDQISEAREAVDDEQIRTDATPRRRRRLVRSVMMRPRRLLVRVHRWLSFGLMAWLVVVSLTGAWLVEHHLVDSWIHHDRYRTTPGDVGLGTAVDAATAAGPPGATVSYAETRRNARGSYKISLEVPKDPAAPMLEGVEPEVEYVTYFVDPGSGTVTGRANDEEGLSWWLYRGHMYLWQDFGLFGAFDPQSGWCRVNANGVEPGGAKGVVCDVIPSGDDMVAWFALGWIVVLLTGFYLWYWPGVRRWATALVIRRRRGAFALNLSIHKVVGIVVWLPLTVIAFTGAAFAFPNASKWFENVTPAGRDVELWVAPEDLASGDAAGRTPLGVDDILAVVGRRYPDRAVDGVIPPLDDTGTFSAWVTRGFSPWTREDGGGNVYMVFDQYSGDVLYDGTPEAGNVFDQAWDDYSFPVHAGDIGGATTRVVWVALAVTPIALGTSGLVMNRIRHRKRAAAAGRSQMR